MKDTDSKIAVIILNYKTYDLTEKCVNALLNHSGDIVDIIIVDNNSNNDSYQRLQAYFGDRENCTILKSEENGGYACGNNLGLKYAYQRGYCYALLMNNDVYLDKSCITEAVAYLINNKNCLCVGPAVITNGTRESVLREERLNACEEIKKNLLLLPLYLTNRLYRKIRKKKMNIDPNTLKTESIRKVYAISGCCLFMDLEKMKKIGYFDEGTFLYCEEYILGERALSAGYDIVYYPTITVHHLHGITTMSIYNERQRDAIVEQSMEYYINKYRNDISQFYKSCWIASERIKNKVHCPIIYWFMLREGRRKRGNITD